MRKEKSLYARLGGQGATLTYYARLYLGPDHLLQAASNGYSETYKRFYFRDIQAIMIRRTNLWLLWMALCLLPALGVAIAAVASSGSDALVLWGISSGLLILPGINLWLGPTCVCHIRTAVQTEQIPSLKRLRKARGILARIKPLVDAAQARLAEPEPNAPAADATREGLSQAAAWPPGPEPPPPTAPSENTP